MKVTWGMYIGIGMFFALTFSGGHAIADMPPEKNRSFQGRAGAHGRIDPVKGTLQQVADDKLIVLTAEGETKEIFIDGRTRFVREEEITLSDIAPGDRLMLMPPRPHRGASISPRFIRVLPGKAFGPEPEAGDENSGKRDFPPAHGPDFPEVTGKDPLKVVSRSGEETVVNVTRATRIVRAVNIDRFELSGGVDIMVFPHPGASQREITASRVVAAGEKFPEERAGRRPPEPGAERREMAAELPVRPADASLYRDSPFGFLCPPPQPGYLFDLGVHWCALGPRIVSWEETEKEKGVYDFSGSDKRICYLNENGLNTVIELRPLNPLYGTRSVNSGPAEPEFPEAFLEEWKKFVGAVAERYDGDGVNDAACDCFIKDYQLYHELLPPMVKRSSYWRENPQQYAELFKATYDALHSACPDCTLYFAGGFYKDFILKGEKTLDGSVMEKDGFYADILSIFNRDYKKMPHIGFDYHCWSFWNYREDSGPETYTHHRQYISAIRKLSERFGYGKNISIISKEAGVNGFLGTEVDQAVYIVKIYASSLAAGQKHLFWTSLVEYSHEADFYTHMGLVCNDRNRGYAHRKVGYYTYKLMVDKLAGSDFENARMVSSKDSVYLYKFPSGKGGKTVYIAWWDAFEQPDEKRKRVTLKLENMKGSVSITDSVPEKSSGDKFTDSVHFPVKKADVKNGRITVSLDRIPVFIEQGSLLSPAYKLNSINKRIGL